MLSEFSVEISVGFKIVLHLQFGDMSHFGKY